MNPSDNAWATACAHILTSQTAQREDIAACRTIMARGPSWGDDVPEVTWPLAVTVVGLAAAAAWGLPRLLRVLWW